MNVQPTIEVAGETHAVIPAGTEGWAFAVVPEGGWLTAVCANHLWLGVEDGRTLTEAQGRGLVHIEALAVGGLAVWRREPVQAPTLLAFAPPAGHVMPPRWVHVGQSVALLVRNTSQHNLAVAVVPQVEPVLPSGI